MKCSRVQKTFMSLVCCDKSIVTIKNILTHMDAYVKLPKANSLNWCNISYKANGLIYAYCIVMAIRDNCKACSVRTRKN